MRKTNLILVLAVALSGCVRYIQVEDAAVLPEPGAEVRALLATPQPLELGTVTINDVSRVEGDVYRSEGDTLGVFSRRIISAYGFSQYTNGAVFYFDRSEFQRLEQRKLLPLQTAIVATAATAGLLAVMYHALGMGGGAADGGKSDGTEFGRTAVIPLSWIFR